MGESCSMQAAGCSTSCMDQVTRARFDNMMPCIPCHTPHDQLTMPSWPWKNRATHCCILLRRIQLADYSAIALSASNSAVLHTLRG